MGSRANLKKIIKKVVPRPAIDAGLLFYKKMIHGIDSFFYQFPQLIFITPLAVRKRLAYRAFMFPDRKKQLMYAATLEKNYTNFLQFRAKPPFYSEESNDRELIASTKESYFLLEHNPGQDVFEIILKKSIAKDKKIRVLHLAGYFVTASCTFSVLKQFFLHADYKHFAHMIFSRHGYSDSVKKWLDEHQIEVIEGTLNTQSMVHCDVVIDWDGVANPCVLKRSDKNRPFVASFGNDFLPNGRSDGFFTFDSASNFSYLPESKDWKEKIFSLPDKATLGFFDEDFPIQDSPLPLEVNSFVTFGTFSATLKMTDLTFQMWADILNVVPQSCLEFCYPQYIDSVARKWILEKFTKKGIHQSRITFSTVSGYPEYCQQFLHYDIILGAYPWPGGRITAHSLENGFFPLVLMKKNSAYSNLLKSYFRAVDSPELILESPEEYVAFAKMLSKSPQCIKDIREKVRSSILDYRKNQHGFLTKSVEKYLLEICR